MREVQLAVVFIKMKQRSEIPAGTCKERSGDIVLQSGHKRRPLRSRNLAGKWKMENAPNSAFFQRVFTNSYTLAERFFLYIYDYAQRVVQIYRIRRLK